MPSAVTAIAAALIAYGLGCISTGYYLVRLRTGRDLRSVGSGATGGRNAGRVLGRMGFVATGAGDLAKSVAAVLIPVALGWGPLAVGAAIVGVTAGHIWPVQLGFRGGRGIAPFVGTSAIVAPVAFAVGAAAGLVFAGVSRKTYVGGLAGLALTPLAAYLLGAAPAIAAGCLVSYVLVAAGHRGYLREELDRTPARVVGAWVRGIGGDG